MNFVELIKKRTQNCFVILAFGQYSLSVISAALIEHDDDIS